MASPRAPRWPPPLMLLLLPLLLPPPAAPGTRGQPPAAARRAPLAAAGPAGPPGGRREREPPPLRERRTVPGPGAATRGGRPSRLPRGARAGEWGDPGAGAGARPAVLAQAGRCARPGATAARDHWPERNTKPHIENISFYQNLEDLRAVGSEDGARVQPFRISHASPEAREPLALLTGTISAEGRSVSSSGTNFTISPEVPTALTSQGSTLSYGSIKDINDSSTLQSPSASQPKSMRPTTAFTRGAPRTPQSLTVSLRPVNKTEAFPEDSKAATPSSSVPSSPAVAELQSSSRGRGSPGDGGFLESPTESEFGLPSFHWQNDSATFGGRELASSSAEGNGNSTPQAEEVSKSARPIPDGQSTVYWLLTNSRTVVDLEDRLVPGLGSDAESTSRAHSHRAHTSAMLAGSGERTLRSLSFTITETSVEAGGSSAAPRKTEGSTPHGNVTEDSGLLPWSPAALPALGVTGLSSGQVSGTDTEQRTSSDHTDHTYVSSTFTKGERALLSIADNSSSSDISESSTSYIKISSSPHSEYSSHAQTKRSDISSYDGEYAQPSTESLVPHTSSLPSYTSTINVANTLVLLDSNIRPVGDLSSSSGPPLSLPSVSQSHQFSSNLPSTRTSTHELKSTSEVSMPPSSSPSLLQISLMASTPAPLSLSQTTLPHSSSTRALPKTRGTPATSVQTLTVASSVTTLFSSQTADPKNQSTPQQEKIVTEGKSPSLVSLHTEPTRAATVSARLPQALTESSTEPAFTAMRTNIAHMSPASAASTFKTSYSPATSPSALSNKESLITSLKAVQTTTGKQLLTTHPDFLVPPVSTEGGITTEGNQVHTAATTQSISLTSAPTSMNELTTTLGITKKYSPTSPFLRTSFPQAADVSTAEMLTLTSVTLTAQSSSQSPVALTPPASVDSCAPNPCLHDGKCTTDLSTRGYQCMCPPSWRGDDCSIDVNECLLGLCPPQATCNNTQGSFICTCPVGYQLEKGICNLVRTFVTEFKLKKTFLNTTLEKHSDIREVENEITRTLNVCFSALPGYIRSPVHVSREPGAVFFSLQSTFSLASNVTLFDLADRIQKFVNSCRSSAEVCQILGSQRRIFRAGSLCKRKSPECDRETSVCTDLDGVALCQCKSGYFQFNKMDHSCRACEDGYRLENETCTSCPFGLGGLNCGNPYQLITVVIAAAGGGLLLILGTALIVTCCRKNKNDISKLIFKSGDFQMSPYAEHPKNPRSQEWGREAIEMHENGSTKNLLQMTDVCYSPTNVRNPELERSGLYPVYTGLPGSRHSCIFPGQYNPSFISDESRRRDYF
ncbi:protein HEG homolog 1 [Ctenodactylus gundi]